MFSDSAKLHDFYESQSPQFELPTITHEAFNLAGEVAVDGESVQRQIETAAQKAREAKDIEKKQQTTLYELQHRKR